MGDAADALQRGGLTMLDFVRGGGARFCDGVSRREFLRAGGLTMGGLSLAQLGALETAAARRTRTCST